MICYDHRCAARLIVQPVIRPILKELQMKWWYILIRCKNRMDFFTMPGCAFLLGRGMAGWQPAE